MSTSSGLPGFPEYKRKVLERRRQSLIEEYEAVTRQMDQSLETVSRVRLKRQMDDLERQITELESQLEPNQVIIKQSSTTTSEPRLEYKNEVPQQLLDQITSKTSTLFVGQGLSVSAGLPSWKEWIAPLIPKIDPGLDVGDILSSQSLPDILQTYELQFGRKALIQYMRTILKTQTEPSKAHLLVARLPIRTIVTTCYDDLLEKAFYQEGKKIRVLVRTEDLPYWQDNGDEVLLVKLSGDLNQPESILVTHQDFETYSSKSAFIFRLVEMRTISTTSIFVGYHPEDPDWKPLMDLLSSLSNTELRSHLRRSYFVTTYALKASQVPNLTRYNCEVIQYFDPSRKGIKDNLVHFFEDLLKKTDVSITEHIEIPPRGVNYEQALERLGVLVYGFNTDAELEYSTLGSRWRENLRTEQLFGSSESSRNARSQLVFALNELSLKYLGISFNDLSSKDLEDFPDELRRRFQWGERRSTIKQLAISDKASERASATRQSMALLAEMPDVIVQDSEMFNLLKALRQDSSSIVRREYLSGLLSNYSRLPDEMKTEIEYFAASDEPEYKIEVGLGIIRQFDTWGKNYESLLMQLAQDSDEDIRREILQAIRSKIDYLPQAVIRLALTAPLSIRITVQKGQAMLVGEQNELILRVTNDSKDSISPVRIEIVEPSAEYTVISANPVSITSLVPSNHVDINFTVIVKANRQIALSYKINEELQENPLYINAIKDNPYVYGNPIREEIAFFGRQSELSQIVQAVTKPNKQDTFIVGERRTGKTSLLYQVQRHLDSPFIPIYITLAEVEKPTTNGILNFIITEIVAALQKRKLLNGYEQIEYQSVVSGFRSELERIMSIAKQNIADLRIVLLLDEADFLLSIYSPNPKMLDIVNRLIGKEPSIDESSQRILRAALQSQSVGADLCAVVAGTHALSTYVSKNASPFFNHFRFILLKPLTEKDTRELILTPAKELGYSYASDALARIIQLSGGHPYYTQALCYESFDKVSRDKRKQISIEDVLEGEQKVISSLYKAFLSTFWNRANRREKKILKNLANDVPLPTPLQSQIKRLLDWQIVTEDNGQYIMLCEIFKIWILRALRERG